MLPSTIRAKSISVVAFLGIVTGLASQSLAVIDVLVNQAGYEPNSPKVFRAQRNADFGGDGTFSVKRTSDNAVVFSGTLTRKGGLWDKWYWEGDFGSYTTAGDYYVTSVVNGESANSYNFNIGNNTLRSQTGVLTYRYFLTQRCGSAVTDPYDGEFWHGLCHMDDGVRSGPYMHMDAVGGWHDAGDYNKFPHVFAANGVSGLLWLYDNNRSYFDGINVDGNGIPDIIDEALYQARWLAKMVDDSSGHILQQTRINRTGATFVRPESDTNNTICNCNSPSSCDACDDRWIDNGTEATPQEIVCSAALIKMHIILASKGLPTENFATKALAIWNHRVALAISEGGHNNLGAAADHIFAGLDLFTVFGQQDCYDRALQKVDEMQAGINSNPGFYDLMDYAEGPGMDLGALAWFARNYPSTYPANGARNAVIALMDRNINYLVGGNPIGLIRRDDAGTLHYFPTNPDNNGFFLGINRLYLLLTWGAIESYRLVGDANYLKFAMDQYNWVMGANYNRVCMMDEAGDFNLYKYHTRYYKIPGHGCGKQPGVVPNGYVRTYSTGLPQMDLSSSCTTLGRYQTTEGWLINNAAYAYAISELFVMNGGGTPQSPYGGTPRAIPGVVQAEDFDEGGPETAYHDNDATNNGGQYRTGEQVDIEGTTDTGGGYNVGWTGTGEWLEYTVNVNTTGDYAIKLRLASGSAGGTVSLSIDGSNIATGKSFAGTGGWQNWTTVIVPGIFLSSGNNKILRLTVTAGDPNVNSIDFTFGGADVVSYDLDTTSIPDGMDHPQVSDGDTVGASIGGHNCRKNSNPAEDFYMYFSVADIYALNGNKASATLTFDYYDAGSGNLVWQYDGAGSPYTSGPNVALTNTNTWKSTTMNVSDAYFGNRQNGGADFRIAAPPGIIWHLDTVMIFAQAGTLPGQASNPSPANGATGVDKNADLTWTVGSGATSHDVRFGTANPPPFVINQTGTTYDPGTLTPGTLYYWRIDEKNGAGTTTGVVWSFTVLPLPGTASAPNPANGATGVATNAQLSWTAGSNTTSHDVRFGTANPPPFVVNQTGTTYNPGTLANSTTYFWRIDEVNSSGTTTGTVWSFTTVAAGGGVIFSNSAFTSGADSWNIVVWRSGPNLDGTMAFDGTLGNPAGSMKSGASGGTNNTDSCTREGGEINKLIATTGYSTISVQYDLRFSTDQTGTGCSGTCPVLEGDCADKLAVYYSTSGTAGPWTLLEQVYASSVTQGVFNTRTVNLPAGANNQANFALRFRFQFNTSPTDFGWLDNIKVSGTPSGPTTILNSPFNASAESWNIVVWRAGQYTDGTMAWFSTNGNPTGNMRSAGSGSSNNTDPCTREGGEINKAVSTAGYNSLVQVVYDLRMETNQTGTTCAGSCMSGILNGDCADKICVFYSTAGTGGPWTLLEQVLASSLAQNTWFTRTINCPAGANNQANFAVRFRWQFNQSSDGGRLDNVKVIATP